MMGKRLMLGITVGAVLVLGSASGAFAGEVGGSGKPAQGAANAKSECAFSGLEDGSENPDAPSGPGSTQNWGHSREFAAEIGATGHGASELTVTTPEGTFSFGCNAHVFPMK
jgi:hypothetical protein